MRLGYSVAPLLAFDTNPARWPGAPGQRVIAVEAREDHATARLAGLPADAMIDRIEIIGYLIMHTRQLDMIMADPASVAHYRAKIGRDIREIADRSR